MDTRRDEGQYYMYGKRVMPTAPTDGDVRHAEFEGIEELPAKFTDEDVRRKMNTLIGTLKGTTAAIAVAFALPLFGAGVTVETARKGEIYNDEPVVVGVAFDASGLATADEVGSLSSRVSAASLASTNYTDAAIGDLIDVIADRTEEMEKRIYAKVDAATETNAMQSAAIAAITAPKRYALFIVDVNCETSGAFTGFELKGTTNNFSHAVTEDVRLQFYSQSEIADTGREGHIDRMMLFVCTSHDSEDVRSWTRIPNTIEGPH